MKGNKVQRINRGMYTEKKEVLLDGNPVTAEFRVYRMGALDQENIKKKPELIDTQLWAWDCPILGIFPGEPHKRKILAIEAMQESCAIGFRTIQVPTVALAAQPTKQK